MLKSEELIKKVKSYNKFLNPVTLNKAYEFALKAHKTQKRDEGSSIYYSSSCRCKYID